MPRFTDYPDFKPDYTPRQVMATGAFGGTYWRPIYSAVTKKRYQNVHKKYNWGLPEELLSCSEYDKSKNKYSVKVGSSLEEWEGKNWITHYNPYGWFHWYCDFYEGRRTPDDERQVKRWLRTAGPNSRFYKRLQNMRKVGKDSLAIRQTLLHWAVKYD